MIDEKKLIDDIESRFKYWENKAVLYDEAGDTVNMDICDGKALELRCLIKLIKKQPQIGEWIPVSEGLPKERDWYLAVFRESDTGFILIPRVAEYVGRETKITTKDYWIIIDLSTPVEYIRNLECIAWQPKPEPWKGE